MNTFSEATISLYVNVERTQNVLLKNRPIQRDPRERKGERERENESNKLTKTKHHYGSRREKTCLRSFANNKGADQPAHPRSLISAFVIRLSEGIISRLAMSEILIF